MNIGIEFEVFKDTIEPNIDKQNIIKNLFLTPNKNLSSQVIEQLKNEGNNIYIIINEKIMSLLNKIKKNINL